MSVMRIRYEKRGCHIHCRVFTSPRDDGKGTFANCGTLVFDEREWPQVRSMFNHAEYVNDAAVTENDRR